MKEEMKADVKKLSLFGRSFSFTYGKRVKGKRWLSLFENFFPLPCQDGSESRLLLREGCEIKIESKKGKKTQ